MEFSTLPLFLIINFLLLPLPHALDTISFTTLGRSSYAFDIFALPTAAPSQEIRLTFGDSVNFNGHFPPPQSISFLSDRTEPDPIAHLVYVTERNGSSQIFLNVFRSALQLPTDSSRSEILLIGEHETNARTP